MNWICIISSLFSFSFFKFHAFFKGDLVNYLVTMFHFSLWFWESVFCCLLFVVVHVAYFLFNLYDLWFKLKYLCLKFIGIYEKLLFIVHFNCVVLSFMLITLFFRFLCFIIQIKCLRKFVVYLLRLLRQSVGALLRPKTN